LRVVTPTGDVVYEHVEPANPSAADLGLLTGNYESRETGTTIHIDAGSKPGELIYRIGSGEPVTLRPTFRDAFVSPSGTSIYFIRDPGEKVTALSAGEDRVWELRFTRIR
jgi:hypothetical protein